MVPFDHGPYGEGEAVCVKWIAGEVLGIVYHGKAYQKHRTFPASVVAENMREGGMIHRR